MHFDLVDRVVDLGPGRIVTVKLVSAGEEYLRDHFPEFPVLPGVLMLEAMVQAARRLVESEAGWDASAPPRVLGRVRALKYGRFVRPGDTLRVTVERVGDGGAGERCEDVREFKGVGEVIEPDAIPGAELPTAVSGRFTLRPARPSNAGG